MAQNSKEKDEEAVRKLLVDPWLLSHRFLPRGNQGCHVFGILTIYYTSYLKFSNMHIRNYLKNCTEKYVGQSHFLIVSKWVYIVF